MQHRTIIARLLLSFVLITLPLHAGAEDAQSLSLTLAPPLYQIAVAREGVWASTLRVVNTNQYDIVVSIKVVDFHPDGETGNAVLEYAPAGSAEDPHRMSGWVTVPSGQITITRDSTQEIPLMISVPLNADPGGHYAALLVGTEPGSVGGSGAGISSAISSLIFLRVPGEVIEEGAIRDFYADTRLVQTPEASFVLRFENTGNVHLVPQGQIVITNMWGKERGKIDVNEMNTFGNVLPKSTRKFEFTWQGEANPFEIGRYKAFATLVYGTEDRMTVFRSTYFWVVPFKPLLGFVLGLSFFIWFVTWSLRRYIRKALALERERLGLSVGSPPEKTHVTPTVSAISVEPTLTLAALRRPLDLTIRDREQTSPVSQSDLRSDSLFSRCIRWVKLYRPIIAFFLVLAIGFGLIGWYFVEVFRTERTYQMEQVRDHQ